MSPAISVRLGDGRLHLQHGPIDVVIEGWGARQEVEAAYAQAELRFTTILPELVIELPRLRERIEEYPSFEGPVARRMAAAVWPHRAVFITPMAAVAGAVADELLAALLKDRRLHKASVNDGGDIALYLAPGESIDIGIVRDLSLPAVDASTRIEAAMPARGVATSGWRGRSQSLGIADAVTVVARNGAVADAAATMVANAVNAEHPAIRRLPARGIKEDSDLGDLPVTVDVGRLPARTVEAALDSGLKTAAALQKSGLLCTAFLALQGETRVLAATPLREELCHA